MFTFFLLPKKKTELFNFNLVHNTFNSLSNEPFQIKNIINLLFIFNFLKDFIKKFKFFCFSNLHTERILILFIK